MAELVGLDVVSTIEESLSDERVWVRCIAIKALRVPPKGRGIEDVPVDRAVIGRITLKFPGVCTKVKASTISSHAPANSGRNDQTLVMAPRANAPRRYGLFP